MPAVTPLGLPYPVVSDRDQTALDIGRLALAADKLINTNYEAVSYCMVTRPSSDTMTVSTTGSRPGSFSGIQYNRGSLITYGGGMMTVTKAGLFRWWSTAEFVSGAGQVWLQVELALGGSGAATIDEGHIRGDLSATHRLMLSTSGAVRMTANSTLQLVLTSPDGVLTAGGIPRTFGMQWLG